MFWEAQEWSKAAVFAAVRPWEESLHPDCRGAVECFHPCADSLGNGQRSENTSESFVPWSLNSSLESSGQQQVLL